MTSLCNLDPSVFLRTISSSKRPYTREREVRTTFSHSQITILSVYHTRDTLSCYVRHFYRLCTIKPILISALFCSSLLLDVNSGIPRVFISCNSGARIGLVDELKPKFKVSHHFRLDFIGPLLSMRTKCALFLLSIPSFLLLSPDTPHRLPYFSLIISPPSLPLPLSSSGGMERRKQPFTRLWLPLPLWRGLPRPPQRHRRRRSRLGHAFRWDEVAARGNHWTNTRHRSGELKVTCFLLLFLTTLQLNSVCLLLWIRWELSYSFIP